MSAVRISDSGRGDALSKVEQGRWLGFLLVVVLLSVTFLLNIGTIPFDFVSIGDPDLVLSNPYVQSPSPASAWLALTRPLSGHHLPVETLSFMADSWLTKTRDPVSSASPLSSARFFHLSNILIHLAGVALLYFVLVALIGNRIAAFVGALLFAVHPLGSEPVAWISARSYLLGFAFAAASLLCFVNYDKAARRGRRALLYLLSLVLFMLGALSCHALLLLPLILIAYDAAYWDAPDASIRHRVLDKLPFVVIALGLGAFQFLLLKDNGCLAPYVGGSFFAALLTATRITAAYVTKLVMPVGLYFGYTVRPVSLATVEGVLSVVGLLAYVGLTIFALKRSRVVFFLMAWFLVWAVAGWNLVPLRGAQVMSDVHIHLARVGLGALLAYALIALVRKANSRTVTTLAAVALACGVAGLGWMTVRQNRVWANSETLGTHTLAWEENNYIALAGLGDVKQEQDDLDGALDLYSKASEARRSYAPALMGLASVYRSQDNLDGAAEYYRLALKAVGSPLITAQAGRRMTRDALLALGAVLIEKQEGPLKSEDIAEAADALERALEEVPELLDNRQKTWALSELAKCELTVDRLDKALAHARSALELDPDQATARQVVDKGEKLKRFGPGLESLSQGCYDEAAAFFSEVVQAQPRNVDAYMLWAQALMRQGKTDDVIGVLADADREVGDNVQILNQLGELCIARENYQGAIDFLMRAVRADEKNVRSLELLATAYFKQRSPVYAKYHAQELLRLDPQNQVAARILRDLGFLKPITPEPAP